MSMIPLSGTDILEFTPPFFARQIEGGDLDQASAPVFYIRVPTFAMRDKMAALLFQRGLIPATVSQGRGILIDALYELYDEATADEHAGFLETYWTKSEVHDELVQAWQIREAQRIFDRAMGVKKDIPEEPLPPAPFTMREQARQASILTRVLDESDRYRTYQARFMVQQEEEDEMLMRLFIDGWKNCGDVGPKRDELDRLTLESIEDLRGWFDQQGAKSAWDDVKSEVKSQFGGSGQLEKNFDSLLDTNSNQTGSQTSSGDLATSDGSSTTSSITPTPASESAATSASSSNSRSSKKGRTSRATGKKSGRMGAPS